MAKEEPGRLFSKVAKFVRNPLKDWSELDAQDSTSPEAGYSREMLKEMIERRQRNDFVRRREFDMLRKLRQREAAGVRDAGGHPSSFNINSTTGKTEGRALTLKKIDEIEEQMSQQWWKGRGPQGQPPTTPAGDGATTVPPHTTAAVDAPASGAGSLHPSRLMVDTGLEEASIRFAHGDDAGAEAILLQTLAPDAATADHDESWRALFDLYRALGDADKFNAAGMRYAQRLRRHAPEWISLRALARDVQAAADSELPLPGASAGSGWVSPARLTRESLVGLTRALTAAGAVWQLDWRGLDSIDADAANPLRVLFAHWANSPVQLRFAGGDRLLEVLASATPTNDRRVDVFWWQLRMEAMRLMQLPDDFELVALNYCITYEVSPPPWEDAKGSYAALDAAPPLAPRPVRPGGGLADIGAGPSAEPAPTPAVAGHRLLAGELRGESLVTWQRLEAELADATTPTISCAALVRIDFEAAGSLLNWVSARDARNQRVAFVDAHRLIAAFFKVIGIADHAGVGIRTN